MLQIRNDGLHEETQDSHEEISQLTHRDGVVMQVGSIGDHLDLAEDWSGARNSDIQYER